MNGHWVKATNVAQHVVSKLSGTNAHLLLIYLELAQGNTDAALAIAEKQPVRPPS
jgi:hypothetical protein